MALRLCLFLSIFMLASCSEEFIFNTSNPKLMRTDNFGSTGAGDGQDVGVTIIENKQNIRSPLEVSFSYGAEFEWNGVQFPAPVLANNYRVVYDQKFRPLKVVPQITGGRAHSFRSIIDTQGNRYIASYVKNTVTFSGTTISFLPITQNKGLFYKEDKSGNLKWYYKIEGTGASGFNQFALDTQGNAYIVGNYAGTSSLHLNEDKVIDLDNTYNNFVAKISPSGDLLWYRYFKITQIRDIEIHDNKILLSGYFTAQLLIEDKVDVTSLGSNDGLVALYDLDGNYLWHKQMGDAGNDMITCGVLDKTGIYVAGSFSANPVIDGQTIKSLTDTGSLLKLDHNGNLIWSRSLGDKATGTPVQSNCISLYKNHVYWGTSTDGESQMESAPPMNVVGKNILLFQVEKKTGKTVFYDSFSGHTASSVFETFVDQFGRLTLGLYWTGTTLEHNGQAVAKNAGSYDAFVAFYLVPKN